MNIIGILDSIFVKATDPDIFDIEKIDFKKKLDDPKTYLACHYDFEYEDKQYIIEWHEKFTENNVEFELVIPNCGNEYTPEEEWDKCSEPIRQNPEYTTSFGVDENEFYDPYVAEEENDWKRIPDDIAITSIVFDFLKKQLPKGDFYAIQRKNQTKFIGVDDERKENMVISFEN